MTHVVTAPDIAEDVVMAGLATLDAYGPRAWAALPPMTLSGLLDDPDADTYIRRAFVAQHQDTGGQPSPVIHSAGWRGLVTVKCLSATRAFALDGRDRLHTAMFALTPPTGYGVAVRYSRPCPPLDEANGIYHRGAIYELTIRSV